jgi:hypothetical protein
VGYLSDWRYLGYRRRRAFVLTAVTGLCLIVAYSANLSFIGAHNLVRHNGPRRVDLSTSAQFMVPLTIFVLFGLSGSIFQGYTQWTVATYSNDPIFLSHLSGIVEALRALGLAAVFVVDSHGVAFILEGSLCFGLTMIGLLRAGLGSLLYLRDSEYGREESVIVPEKYEKRPDLFVRSTNSS